MEKCFLSRGRIRLNNVFRVATNSIAMKTIALLRILHYYILKNNYMILFHMVTIHKTLNIIHKCAVCN